MITLNGFKPMSKRYYGDKKIETAQEEGERVIITFSDNTTLNIPKKLFEVSVSKEPLNPTQLWDKQLEPVAKETLELWLSWDIRLDQLDYLVLHYLKSSIESNHDKAGAKLWGKNKDERRLSDIDKILKSSDGKQN